MTIRIRWKRVGLAALALAGAFLLLSAVSLLILKWVNPITTAVQAQRRMESWFQPGHYRKQYDLVAIDRISPHLAHATMAAEDARFFQHHGFDWSEIKDAVTEDLKEGRIRGASTISQQLVKNLYLTTYGGPFRKAAEVPLVILAEFILGKRRILELYLNVIEMGPGIYGEEAAASHYCKTSASRLGRDQCARLASIYPSPRRRNPNRATAYSATILNRMSQMSW